MRSLLRMDKREVMFKARGPLQHGADVVRMRVACGTQHVLLARVYQRVLT